MLHVDLHQTSQEEMQDHNTPTRLQPVMNRIYFSEREDPKYPALRPPFAREGPVWFRSVVLYRNLYTKPSLHTSGGYTDEFGCSQDSPVDSKNFRDQDPVANHRREKLNTCFT